MKTLLVFLATIVALKNDEVIGQGFKCSMGNERCDLPFKYNGQVHNSCITLRAGNNLAWCPTKVYEDGRMDTHLCMECRGDQRCYLTGESFSDSSWSVTCPPGCQSVQKNTQGTNNQYATNSYICGAAIHARLINNDNGGVVSIMKQISPGDLQNNEKMLLRRNIEDPDAPQMIFTNKKTMISTLGRGSTTMSSAIVTGQSLANDVICDVRKGKIYWTDLQQRAIFSATFDGSTVSNQKKILQNDKILYPERIAVDWVHGNLYWTDSKGKSAHISDITGQNTVTLIKRSNFVPKGIAVDPNTGHFYVADLCNGFPKIIKCVSHKRDTCETIVDSDENLDTPTSLAIDIEYDRVCWVDSKFQQISCVTMNGAKRLNMKLKEERLSTPLDIALVNGKIYWTDTEKTIIASADLDTWDSFHIHLGEVEDANGLALFDVQTQQNYQDKCRGAPCKYLCVPTQNSYACLCKLGEFLQSDGSCSSQRSILNMYVAETTSISRYSVNLDSSALISKRTILRGLRAVSTVAIDAQRRRIFWADTVAKTIDMAQISDNLVKRNFLNAASGYVSAVEGIAIDSVTRLFYWSDTELHAVYVTNLDFDVGGQPHITALTKGDKNYHPTGIALDSRHGYIYIADSAEPYKIQMCETRGGNGCETLIESNLNQPIWIALDPAAKKLIFTNSLESQILSTSFEGGDRKEIKPRPRVYLPHGVGVYGDRVYWTEPVFRRIASMDKNTGSGKVIIATAATPAYGFALYNEKNPYPDLYPNVCAGSYCQFLCVPMPKDQNSASPHCLCSDKELGKSNSPECRIECEKGYESSPHNGSCIDTDECTIKHNFGNCGINEKCINTPGSYECVCKVGSQRSANTGSCVKLSPCHNHRCENGGECEEFEDKSDYKCKCADGFIGDRCDDLDIRLEKNKDKDTGSIYLRCIVPPGVKSEVIWTLNRDPIHTADRSFRLSDDYKLLVINSPHYTHSGEFSCQFRYKDLERVARKTVIIKASPKIACGESPGIQIDERVTGPKILGGTETKIKFAPFVTMLYKVTDGITGRKGVFCGGSLIDTRHVVTAAHCFQTVSIKEIEVYVGKLQINMKFLEKYQQKSKVKKLIKHPLFNPETLNGDLAILVLEDEIYFSSAVKPICIGHPKKENSDIKVRPWKNGKAKYGIVYGWGLTDDGTYAKRLMEIILPIVNDSACKDAHKEGAVTEMMFCVGGEANRDTCEGDSGGPFTLWSPKENKWYLAGVVSWGFKCGRSDKPGVYTRIGKSMRKWIYKNSDLN